MNPDRWTNLKFFLAIVAIILCFVLPFALYVLAGGFDIGQP